MREESRVIDEMDNFASSEERGHGEDRSNCCCFLADADVRFALLEVGATEVGGNDAAA